MLWGCRMLGGRRRMGAAGMRGLRMGIRRPAADAAGTERMGDRDRVAALADRGPVARPPVGLGIAHPLERQHLHLDGQIDPAHLDRGRYHQLAGGEAQNRLQTGRDQRITDLLGSIVGDGDDRDGRLERGDHRIEFARVTDPEPGHRAPDQRGIVVEQADNGESAAPESAVADEGATEVSRADQHDAVPSDRPSTSSILVRSLATS